MYGLVYVDEASSVLTCDRDTGMSIVIPRHFRVTGVTVGSPKPPTRPTNTELSPMVLYNLILIDRGQAVCRIPKLRPQRGTVTAQTMKVVWDFFPILPPSRRRDSKSYRLDICALVLALRDSRCS